jgi:hypothetical protein
MAASLSLDQLHGRPAMTPATKGTFPESGRMSLQLTAPALLKPCPPAFAQFCLHATAD